MTERLPVIDVGPLIRGEDAREVAQEIGAACRELGFFYVRGHAVEPALQEKLHQLAKEFFALSLEEKLELKMSTAGRAWRGYFPVGGELTSGKPDLKEGLYFGQELGPEHPRVRAGVPLHGANLFPALPGFRAAVLAWMEAMSALGQALMRGVALSLELAPDHFAPMLREPTTLFRIFNYPPDAQAATAERWGVGEHTDYGVLTILLQDDAGGLQVKTPRGWLEAPPIPGTFVCNLGDMLERMTLGRYKSTPHRVRNTARRDRLSFPFFFDPSWDAPLQVLEVKAEPHVRWDGRSVFDFHGTYGEYLLGKVSKVFPELGADVLR